MFFRSFLLILCTFLSLPVISDSELAKQWLEQSHQAAGGAAWDEVVSIEMQAALQLPGLEGELKSLTDVTTGNFIDDATVGPFNFIDGYDGSVHWAQDTSGQVQVQDSQADRESTANSRYRRMYAYWYPERWPARIEDIGAIEDNGQGFHRVMITPEGGRAFEMWLDSDTGLIARLVENNGNRDNITYFSDYRDIDGRNIPFVIRSSSGDERYDDITSLLEVQFNISIDTMQFAKPAAPPVDFHFAGNNKSTTIPFRLLNNHTYVEISLNNQGPFTMILDTGGVNVITPQVAARLGVETQGQMEVQGVGEQTQDMSLAQIDTVNIGDVTINNQLFVVIAFDELSRAEGLKVDGLIGYEVFKRFLVRQDYGISRLTLHDPQSMSYTGSGTAVEFEFDGRTPVVDGAIDGIDGKLTLDTGSRSFISLHAPFVAEHGLLERYPEAMQGITGWGVCGSTQGRVLRGSSLRIGENIVIRAPIMSLSLQERGAMTDRYQIANLGAGILRHFNLVFDYERQVIWFEEREDTENPDFYDRSGFWLNDIGEVFEVMGVVDSGPAADAGVQAGDRVMRVDGRPAVELFLPELRNQWRSQVPGTKVQLELQRQDQVIQTEMVLRDLIAPPSDPVENS